MGDFRWPLPAVNGAAGAAHLQDAGAPLGRRPVVGSGRRRRRGHRRHGVGAPRAVFLPQREMGGGHPISGHACSSGETITAGSGIVLAATPAAAGCS